MSNIKDLSSEDRKTVLVINPHSRKDALGRKWREFSSIVHREMPFEEVYTKGPGDATLLTRDALKSGAAQVIAIGGDGTINEVVNGFFDGREPISPTAAMGVFSFGTGDDFCKSINMPKKIASAARVLARGKTKRIDVGHIEFTTRDGKTAERVYANVSSFGISGPVNRLVNESSKSLGGRLTFLLATLRASFSYKNQRVRLVFDDAEDEAVELTIRNVAIANGRYFGGGMFIAPKAELDDGLFDVVSLGNFGMADMLLKARHVYSGTHLDLDKVAYRRARKVRAESLVDEPIELDVDGETPGLLPATFTVIPGALDLIVPGQV